MSRFVAQILFLLGAFLLNACGGDSSSTQAYRLQVNNHYQLPAEYLTEFNPNDIESVRDLLVHSNTVRYIYNDNDQQEYISSESYTDEYPEGVLTIERFFYYARDNPYEIESELSQTYKFFESVGDYGLYSRKTVDYVVENNRIKALDSTLEFFRENESENGYWLPLLDQYEIEYETDGKLKSINIWNGQNGQLRRRIEYSWINDEIDGIDYLPANEPGVVNTSISFTSGDHGIVARKALRFANNKRALTEVDYSQVGEAVLVTQIFDLTTEELEEVSVTFSLYEQGECGETIRARTELRTGSTDFQCAFW